MDLSWFVEQAEAAEPLLPDNTGALTMLVLPAALGLLFVVFVWWITRTLFAARRTAAQALVEVAELRDQLDTARR